MTLVIEMDRIGCKISVNKVHFVEIVDGDDHFCQVNARNGFRHDALSTNERILSSMHSLVLDKVLNDDSSVTGASSQLRGCCLSDSCLSLTVDSCQR